MSSPIDQGYKWQLTINSNAFPLKFQQVRYFLLWIELASVYIYHSLMCIWDICVYVWINVPQTEVQWLWVMQKSVKKTCPSARDIQNNCNNELRNGRQETWVLKLILSILCDTETKTSYLLFWDTSTVKW